MHPGPAPDARYVDQASASSLSSKAGSRVLGQSTTFNSKLAHVRYTVMLAGAHSVVH